MSQQEESQSTPALIQASERLDAEAGDPSSSLSSIPENNLLESYTRLSISLEDNGLFKVHERQAARMKTRSEWFLSPSICPKMPDVDCNDGSMPYYILREDAAANWNPAGFAASVFSTSAESLKQLIRRSSSKDKERRLVRRTSSKKNKENGASGGNNKKHSAATAGPTEATNSNYNSTPPPPEKLSTPKKSEKSGTGAPNPVDHPMVSEQDCTETDVQTFHVTLTYKPRI